jgi:hypothetical protein
MRVTAISAPSFLPVACAERELLEILQEVRALLALPSNDFAWSSWADAGAALAELDDFIARIETGQRFAQVDLSVLFAPTGPIQEVSVSSRWGDEFCEAAARFDGAFAKYAAAKNL